jgi:uncharacterized protein YukE
VSAAGELATYAGGDLVTAEASKVENSDPGSITGLAIRLDTAAIKTDTNTGAVGKAVRGLDAAWEGTSADQFVAYMARFGKAGTDAGSAITQAYGALDKVAEALTSAKSYVQTRCDQALSEINTWIRNHKDADQAELDAYTKGVCGEVAGDLRKHLDGTEAVLSAAAGTLTSAASPASTFSSIPDPNTQPFTPQPGQRIEWTPTPPSQTTPSGGADNPPPGSGSNGTGGGPSGGGGGGASGGGSTGGGGGGGGGGSLGSSGGPPAGGPPPGNVQEWIKQAIEILRQNGVNVSEADAQYIWQIIQHESGGNPKAINLWDSNAAAGHPSKGLMQCIDSTFNAHKLSGHNDIWNPVDNIIAGVRYSVSRYGSLGNVPGIKAIHSGGGYVGY